ncbi:hypothetical protein CPB86DRAFT_790834 [Serendipita vermifera]|nr:hypothetical protein CPB86DRAFT_790834 [Serendipita vermifera]
MHVTLQNGSWDDDKLEDRGAAGLPAPIGTWTAHEERLRRAGRSMQLGLLSTRSGHQDILRSFGFPGSSAGVRAPT